MSDVTPMNPHPIKFGGNEAGPIYCKTCMGTVCLDGWPERTDGEWMHVRDWKARQSGLGAPELAPATIMAKHAVDWNADPQDRWCATCGADSPCLPYRLAKECARLAARVARVEALAEKWDRTYLSPLGDSYAVTFRVELRAVLDPEGRP